MLSIIGRVQWVKSVIQGMLNFSIHVIQGMLIFSIHIYSWPTSLLKLINNWMCNFVWAGDPNAQKITILINEAAVLKLCWDVLTSSSQWASFCRARFLRHDSHKYIKSFIWPGINNKMSLVKLHSSRIIGYGKSMKFWSNKWLSEIIADALNLPAEVRFSLKATVSDF